MATPITELEFAQMAYDADVAAKSAAQAALVAAQTALAAARAALAAATAAEVAKEKEIAAKRVAVAAADTPAEGATLMDELNVLIAEERVLRATLVEATDTVSTTEGDAVLATAALRRISADVAQAEVALAAATKAQALRDAAKAAATAPPLDTLAADAAAALAADPFTAAENLVTDDIPAKLLEASRNAYEADIAFIARLEDSLTVAEDLLMDELEDNGGARGLVTRRRMELARAERALREWTEHALMGHDRALAQLATMVSGGALLNASESAGVTALDDTPGQDAADARMALVDARAAVADAELNLEEATYTARAPDPTADVSAVQEVVDAQDALDAAIVDLNAAEAAFVAIAEDFTAWTGEVPDPAWRKVLTYLEADGILNQVSDVDAAAVTALVTDVTTAESNLAAALEAERSHADTVAFLEGYVALRANRVTGSGNTLPGRLLSTVRGDA